MTAQARNTSSLPVALLSVGALVVLLFIVYNPFTATPHSAPVWWVSLTAPQYPTDAFPDGIRIHFHTDGVFNGCRPMHKSETIEGETLNCKHEMDTINHYVGMYPIAAGAPVERLFSPFIFSLLALMVVAFAIPAKRVRVALLAAGCIAIGIWMSAALYKPGGVRLLSPDYVADVMSTMDLDPGDIENWSGIQTFQESYDEALGRYFRQEQVIKQRVATMTTAVHVVYWGLLAAMAILVVGNVFISAFYWLLVAVPTALPLFFVVDYAAWLWWFGHTLNSMGAFTVKPFMPTVFGDGKVAQFTTHSYPYWGFGLMLAMSVLLGAAALLRYRTLKEG